MQIYLPVAEIPVNIILILALGLLTGFLAGMFGIGGGFLATPLLMFIGVPPAVAVSTSANQITASSVSGLLAHLKKGNVDFKMGWVLLIGGLVGSAIGVLIFRILHKIGQIDIVVALTYVFFLGSIGSLMFADSIRVIAQRKYGITWKKRQKNRIDSILKRIELLPFKRHFPKSNINISIIVPIVIGVFVGILVSVMGIGGGFIMIPAMVYILKMPSNIVVGTSLFQIIFIAGAVTFMQAVSNQTVDIVLAFLMIISSVIGAQFGTRASYKVDHDKSRMFLSMMILFVCIKMIMTLFTYPESLYTLEVIK
jgi:uncharacterized membrane protein YfcA